MLAVPLRFLFSLALVAGLALFCDAQSSKQYAFKHFSVTNGLLSNTVNDVVQDNDGFIWMATTNGLQRYDGSSFLNFQSRRNSPSSIPSNNVVKLFVDRSRDLWIVGDNNRIGIFDTRKMSFAEVPVVGGGSKFPLEQGPFELHTGDLVFLTKEGALYRFQPEEKVFMQAPGLIPTPAKWNAKGIHWDPQIRKYWVSCDSGLVQWDPYRRVLNYRGHNPDGDPVIKAFEEERGTYKVFVDVRGNVMFFQWMPRESNPEICRYLRRERRAEKTLVGFQGYHEVHNFMQQRNGRLWVFGKPFLAEWGEGSGEKAFIHVPNEYRHEQSIRFDYLYKALEDRDNNIWLTTDNGIFLFNPDAQIFTTYGVIRPDGRPAFEAPVQAMEEWQGDIYVGCWGKGSLTRYNKKGVPLPLPAPFPEGEFSVWDMAVHPRSGDLWITQQAGNLVVLDARTTKFRRYQPAAFENSTIRQIDEDTSGNMWVGLQNGTVLKWDYLKSGGDPSKGYEVVMKQGMVQKVHYDYKGFVWIATLEHGLFKVDAKTKKVVRRFNTRSTAGERLLNDDPSDMTYYDDSTLIVTAGSIHVINTNTNAVRMITTEEGLPSHTALSVERDRSGIVWVGMAHGLCRLNLQKNMLTFYDRRDGIVYDKFEPAGVKELEDGRLVFFTDHNYVAFDPAMFGQGLVPPQPKVTAFSLAGHALSLDSIGARSRAILDYNNTSIGLSFSALSFLHQRVQYYYMMEGLDQHWVRVDRPIEVAYNYLPPGEYRFLVKTENPDGIGNPTIASFPIKVKAPFWQTGWFYSLIGLLLIAILYLLDRERMKRRRSLQEIRARIARNLTDDVSTTLNNINVLSEIAKIKADKDIEQSKDFIDQISVKSRSMIEAMDDALWSIDPANDSMKQTVLRIKELTEGIRSARGAEIDLIVDNRVADLELDMKLRHDLYFFYKEAVLLLLEDLPCGQLFVNFNRNRSRLMIEMLADCGAPGKDWARGFREATSRRVRAMPASLELTADMQHVAAVLYVDL